MYRKKNTLPLASESNIHNSKKLRIQRHRDMSVIRTRDYEKPQNSTI